ncbi:MAG: peroxidase-related enzyme [Planctomycetes bacterium]|nr:peroxidase-related enzyme [Planctomycetota bacterium]
MESHEGDLRSEIKDDAMVRAIQDDYRQVDLGSATRVLLDFAVKLTTQPVEMRRGDVAMLREAGFCDADILDAAHIVGYFNYANRVMDALGIQPEPEMRHRPRE